MKKPLKLWIDAHGPDALATLILGLAVSGGYYGATLGAIELLNSGDIRTQTIGGLIFIAEILVGFRLTATT